MSTQVKKLKGGDLAKLEQELVKYEGVDRIVTSVELAEEMAKTKEDIFTIPTGIKTIDRIHEGGFEPGEMVLVTGPTGEGKTTLLMTITKNMAQAGYGCLWFTLEVTPRQFLSKFLKSGIMPLFYLPNENVDNQIEWLTQRIIEAKVKASQKGSLPLRVVFIDHIHQIFSLAKLKPGANISYEIGDLAGKVKSLALEHNIVVFLIAHNKDDPSGSSRNPKKEDVRDSGLIIRLADTVMGVWRVSNEDTLTSRRKELVEEDTKSRIGIWKNRRVGKLGSFFMWHENHYLTEQTLLDKQFEGDDEMVDENTDLGEIEKQTKLPVDEINADDINLD